MIITITASIIIITTTIIIVVIVVKVFGKGQMGSALIVGRCEFCVFFDRGTFWVLLSTYFFPNLSEFVTFAAAS